MRGAGDILALPPAIERVLNVFETADPQAIATLRPAVGKVMARLLASPEDLAVWGLSQLTAGGYPFEITLTSADALPRLTMELAPPASPRAPRLGEAAAMMGDLGYAPLPELLADLARFQQAGGLDFGAWIGLRARAGGLAVKLYAEVPQGAQDAAMAWLQERLDEPLGLPGRARTIRMFGHDPTQGTLEAYLSIDRLRPWELGALMHPVGLSHRAAELLGVFEAVLRRHLHQSFPTPVLGCSYALTPGAGPVFSLYGFTEHLFGADGPTRRRVLAALERLGMDLPGYAELSRPLADEEKQSRGHGLFGVAVAGQGAPVLHLGLSPQGGCDA